MTSSGTSATPSGTKRYTSPYQRAKACRLHWPDAACSSTVCVKAVIKRLFPGQKNLPGYPLSNKKNKSQANVILQSGSYSGKKITDAHQKIRHPSLNDNCPYLPFTFTSKKNFIHPGATCGSYQESNHAKKQKQPFSFVLSYQFNLPASKGTIILKAFYHPDIETFMIKFYNKNCRSLNKYAVRTNKGGVRIILQTCFMILKQLACQYPRASFGFMGERSFFKDKAQKRTLLEPVAANQRFRIYRLFLSAPQRNQWLIQHFYTYELEALSTCLLLSHQNKPFIENQNKLQQILAFMARSYPELNYADL